MPVMLGATVLAAARAHRARVARLLAPHGLHAGQDILLMAVWDRPGLRQTDLAEQLAVEPPTVTRMVQRLERGGMLDRRPDPHDARVMLVYPSARSRLIEATVRRVWSQLEEEMIAAVGTSEAERVQRVLSTLSRMLGSLD